MAFKYKAIRPDTEIKLPPRRGKPKPKEFFTGQVQGKKASELEERFARSLDRARLGYNFRMRIDPQGSLTQMITNELGEVEIDFMVYEGWRMYPVQIDGEIAHFHGAWEQERDRNKDDIVNDVIGKMGGAKVMRIPFFEIWTEYDSDLKAKRLINEARW